MIRVSLSLDGDGILRALRSSGHGDSGPGGESLVCGIVSAALRSYGKLLAREPGIKVEGHSLGRGNLEFELLEINVDRKEWLKGMQAFLLSTLDDAGKEFPGELLVEINIQKEERKNGT